MKLDISERMGLLSLLPTEGSYTTMRVLGDLRAELGFSEKELKDSNIREANGQTSWSLNGTAPKEVAVGEIGRGIIVTALKRADEAQSLTALTLPLYERFIVNPEG